MMNLKSGNIEGFKPYSQFNSLKEFNNHFEMWLVDYKHKFTKGELVGLKRLARFAAKVPGVSNAKIGTIVKEIQEEYHGNGISRSTFKRMLGKAQQFGILTIYETERKNGSQSSNLYVFNPFPTNELPKAEKMNHHNKTINPSETNNQKINKRKKETLVTDQKSEKAEEKLAIDHTFVSERVPKPFVRLVKSFFPDAKVIEEYWKMVQIAAYRNNSENQSEVMLETAIDSFQQMIRKLKLSIIKKNPFAYFYGVLDRKFHRHYYEQLWEENDVGVEETAVQYGDLVEKLSAFEWWLRQGRVLV